MNRKDLEGSGRGLIEILSRNFRRETAEQILGQDILCPWRNSNRIHPEYESTALLLLQPGRCENFRSTPMTTKQICGANIGLSYNVSDMEQAISEYRIRPNIRRFFFKYCCLEMRGRLIFGYLRINMKKNLWFFNSTVFTYFVKNKLFYWFSHGKIGGLLIFGRIRFFS
jgi:hypothetical protein